MFKKIFFFFLFLFIVFIGVSIGIISEYYIGERIFQGVKISEVYVGGLKKEEAEEIINKKVNEKLKKPLILVVNSNYYFLKLTDLNLNYKIKETVEEAYNLGRKGNIFLQILMQQKIAEEKVNIPLKFSLNVEKLKEKLKEISSTVDTPAVNARILFEKKEIVREKTGYRLDQEDALSKIMENLKDLDNSVVKLEIEEIKPLITEEKLKKINLDVPLAFFSTKFNPSDIKRTHNIKLAAASIDGYVLVKDEIFSYNRVVGPREAKYGYLEAPVIIKGKLLPGEGGGACQVSSTLFNVALLSGFKILERTPHSRPSTYVLPGRDATVVYDYIDLKFQQDTQEIVVFHTKVEKNVLKIYVWGDSPEDIKTELYYVVREVIPNKVVRINDKNLKYPEIQIEEKGNPGYSVKILRVVKKKGKIIRKDFIKSYYKPVDRIIRVGSKKS